MHRRTDRHTYISKPAYDSSEGLHRKQKQNRKKDCLKTLCKLHETENWQRYIGDKYHLGLGLGLGLDTQCLATNIITGRLSIQHIISIRHVQTRLFLSFFLGVCVVRHFLSIDHWPCSAFAVSVATTEFKGQANVEARIAIVSSFFVLSIPTILRKTHRLFRQQLAFAKCGQWILAVSKSAVVILW